MTYRVTLALNNGNTATVNVEAPNKHEAEYRAAMKVETTYHECVSHVVRVNRG